MQSDIFISDFYKESNDKNITYSMKKHLYRGYVITNFFILNRFFSTSSYIFSISFLNLYYDFIIIISDMSIEFFKIKIEKQDLFLSLNPQIKPLSIFFVLL